MSTSSTRRARAFIIRKPFLAALITAVSVLTVMALLLATLMLIQNRMSQTQNVADTSATHQETLLILGVDSQDSSMVGHRSDVIMLMRMRHDPEWIDIVSVPRDSLVDLPDCAGSHATEHSGKKDKLNSAFAYGSVADVDDRGSAQAGMDCAAMAITEEAGIPIDDTIATTFNGVTGIIDSLGGADLPVDEHGRIVREGKGEQHFSGQGVVTQLRARKTETGGSDLSRINHQQEILGALLDYYRSEGIIDSSGSVNSMKEFTALLTALTNGTATTVSLNDVRSLMQRAASTPVSTATLPTGPADDGVNAVWTQQTTQFWQAYKDGEDLPK